MDQAVYRELVEKIADDVRLVDKVAADVKALIVDRQAATVASKVGAHCDGRFRTRLLNDVLAVDDCMTYEDFVATRRYVDDLRSEVEDEAVLPGTKGYVYLDVFFIEDAWTWPSRGDGGRWFLLTGNEVHLSNNLALLQHRLYLWAKSEGYKVAAPPNREPMDLVRLIERMPAEEVRVIRDLLTRREESA